MWTSVGRAAARRALVSTAGGSRAASRGLPRIAFQSRLAIRSAIAARSFSTSELTRAAANASSAASKAKTATKKAATKKKPAAKKPAAKKKKKTVAKKKPAPKKKAVKKLTPEEKTKRELKAIKEMALFKQPKQLPASAWLVYVTQHTKGLKVKTTDIMGQLGRDFRNLSSSERESLDTIAKTNAVANKAARMAWIESHPPEAIWLANWARKTLSRKLNRKPKFPDLPDSRIPKRASPPYAIFLQSRLTKANKEDLVGLFKSSSVEWKALRDTERRTYLDLSAAETAKTKDVLDDLRVKAAALKKVYLAAAKA